MGETYPFLYIVIKQQSSLQNSAMSYFVFRFGGDEFVIVFPNADKEQATKIIRRIQESISAINQKEKLPFYISISYGISEYNGNTKIKINEFIKNADIAMYQNKNLNKANMNQEKNLVLN